VIEEPSWSEQRLMETREIVEDLASQEPKSLKKNLSHFTTWPTIRILRNC
jgi:hypothetical protein